MTPPIRMVPVEPTAIDKLEVVYDWLREPDYGDTFNNKDLVEWLNRRPSGLLMHTIGEVKRAMLTAAPVREKGGAAPYDLSDLCREVRRRYPAAFDGTDPIATHPPSLENATDLFLAVCFAALATREEAPADGAHPCYSEHQPGCDCAIPEQKAVSVPSFLERMTAPAEAGEVEAWLIEHPTKKRRIVDAKMFDASSDGFWLTPDIKAEYIITPLRAQPQAREEVQPVAKQWRALDEQGPRTAWREVDWRSERELEAWGASHRVEYRALYTKPPAPEAEKLREIAEAARAVRQCAWTDRSSRIHGLAAVEALQKALAALQAEQKGGAA